MEARRLRSIFIGMMALWLGACSGGNGDSADDADYSGSTAPVTITSQNGETLVSEVFGASWSLISYESTSFLDLIPQAVVQTDVPTLSETAKQLIIMAQRYMEGSDGRTPALVQQDTLQCAGGGSRSYTVNASTAGTLTTGDSISMSFSGCVESGYTFNGSVNITVSEASGDWVNEAGTWSLGFNITFINYSLSGSGFTMLTDGAMTLASSSADGITVTHSLSGARIYRKLTTSGGTHEFLMRSYNISASLNSATGEETLSMNMILATTAIGGQVTVVTDTPFKWTAGATDPYQGQMTITGANGCSVRLRVIDETSALIEVDADGDGSYESSTPLSSSW